MTRTHATTAGGAPAGASERPLPHLAGVHHRFVDTPRLRFHVAEAGQGEPVLLLHGWPQHWYGWRKLIPLLAGDYRLICPDLRGFGWTDAPRDGYTTAELVDDLLALLDALGLERVLLIGHDRGGWLGFQLCLRAPSRVRRFLALNAVHPWWRARRMLGQAWRSSYTVPLETTLLGRLVVRHVPAFTRLVLRLGVRNRGALSIGDVEEFVAAVREPARARASERLYHHFAYGEILPTALGRYRSARLPVPMLMLNGTRDFALAPRSPETLGGYEPYADDLRVELVEGGHFLADDRPELVAAAARGLFKG
jgi:pimeloyl-ACP methyl ester carboxylesterase